MKLNKLAKDMFEVAKKRSKNGKNIKTDELSMLKHCATEVVEATDALIRFENKSCINPEIDNYWKDFENELADVIACVLIICGGNQVDISKRLKECYEKNKARAEGVGDKA